MKLLSECVKMGVLNFIKKYTYICIHEMILTAIYKREVTSTNDYIYTVY